VVYLAEVLHLQEQIQRASDLAQLTEIIGRIRDSKELTEQDRDFLKVMMWPWWKWILQERGNPGPRPEDSRRDSPLIEMISEGNYSTENRQKLDDLCDALWLDAEVTAELRLFVSTLSSKLRHRLLSGRHI
jgi:hypothetical protein